MEKQSSGPLTGIRVLDLADEKGLYCAKLLGDLGSDVIKIEPPGGDPARNIGPFLKDQQHKEKSLYWFHFNTNKRSITLNLQTIDGKELFKKLASKADIIVETFAPGVMDDMGIGWKILSKANSCLILASITPFGQKGPWKNYKASDLIGSAIGGVLDTCGWPDKAPEKICGSQAYNMASVQATVGILMAFYQRTKTQKGRHIDISMHASLPVNLMSNVPIYERTGQIRTREGDRHSDAAHGIFPCQDGYIDFRLRFQRWNNFLEWLDTDAMAGELKEEKWKDHWYRQRPENMQKIDERFREFLAKHTKKELYEDGQKRGFEIAPVNTVREVAESVQLRERGYFVPVEHPELGVTLEYLGPPFRLSLTPWKIRRRAPLLGEHNEAIYKNELGLNQQELISLAQAGII
ncbi:CaiB/BaiF CoA transferase family protein [Thermodesulfobacteriota bacterium]